MTASAASTSTTLRPIDRHRQALDRRRATLSRDRERGACATVLDGHQVAIDRLASLIARVEERAATEVEHAQIEARLAAKEQREDALALAQCGAILTRIERRSAVARDRRKAETPADRRRARLAKLRPHTERDAAIQPARAMVPNPYNPGSYETVTTNRRVDILAQEKAAKRITEAEFLAGRKIQDMFEAASGVRISAAVWSGNSTYAPRSGLSKIEYGFDQAKKAKEFSAMLESVVGGAGVAYLRALLVEGETFASYAARTVGAGERNVTRVADRFRWLLETVVDGLYTSKPRHQAPIVGGPVSS